MAASIFVKQLTQLDDVFRSSLNDWSVERELCSALLNHWLIAAQLCSTIGRLTIA